MKTIKTIALAVTMLIASAGITSAHEAKGPHGGHMIDATNKYHAELLIKDNRMNVYLLDDKGKSMSNKGVTGSIILQFSDKTSATVKLTPYGEDGFEVKNDKSASYTSCVVTFKVKNTTAVAKFKNKKEHAKKYQCSMKCEGDKTYSEPGKCPKCGMELTEVKQAAGKEEKKEEHKHSEGEKHHH